MWDISTLNRQLKALPVYQEFIQKAMKLAYKHQMRAGIDRSVLELKVVAIIRSRRRALGKLTTIKKKKYAYGKKCGRPGV